MPLHRAKNNDWDTVSFDKRSVLQQIAAKSNGVITVPNFITLIGGGLVCYGLFFLLGDVNHIDILRATVLIALGRLLDIADGYVAEWTKTKSPFGEALDVSVDKITLLIVASVLLAKNLLPVWVLLAMLSHSIYNSILSFAAYIKNNRFHPSFVGKMAVWFEWVSITIFLVSTLVINTSIVHISALVFAWICFTAFAVLGAYSSFNYTLHFSKFTKKIH